VPESEIYTELYLEAMSDVWKRRLPSQLKTFLSHEEYHVPTVELLELDTNLYSNTEQVNFFE
jgi:hypothetical protein